ncbi:ATP-binding protein [Streptomyces sp. NPDC060022]|uniref:ATP-binding protein n=1 Tax=Streptomyces sp. NPDC060022 TaxID=3347039 RepID=UPI00367F6119
MKAQFSFQQRCGEAACQVGVIRRIAGARLRDCGLQAMTDDVMLIVSELVTNAILHSGGTQIAYEMALRDGALYITVSSDGEGGPRAQAPHDDAETGRGLLIVGALAEAHHGEWGTSDNGATTWCRLALPVDHRR